MKQIGAVFFFIIWLIGTFFLIITIIGLVVVADDDWIEIPRRLVSVFLKES